jgi:DNA invertase Pin-like site-specific DNA recombinase
LTGAFNKCRPKLTCISKFLCLYGCERIFTDTAGGALNARRGLIEALEFCRRGDCLPVWKMDRLGRGLKHSIETIAHRQSIGVGFVSLQESIDRGRFGRKARLSRLRRAGPGSNASRSATARWPD